MWVFNFITDTLTLCDLKAQTEPIFSSNIHGKANVNSHHIILFSTLKYFKYI